jgi:hypothetical protein
MLVRTTYDVHVRSRLGLETWTRIRFPITATVTDDATVTLEVRSSEHPDSYLLTVHRRVVADGLELVREGGQRQVPDDGTEVPIPAVRVPDVDQASTLSGVFLDALAFLADATLTRSRSMENMDTLIAETPEDAALLDTFGTSNVYVILGSSPSIRTFSAQIDGDAVMALLPKAPGLRLYADSLRAAHSVAQFRDLWRVLESAFGAGGRRLVELMSAYWPAVQIGFTRTELDRLYVLRGRASHAQSRAGLDEILAVEREVQGSVERLKSLVERVIVTKEPWGAADLAHRELLPPTSWVGPGGSIVLIQR